MIWDLKRCIKKIEIDYVELMLINIIKIHEIINLTLVHSHLIIFNTSEFHSLLSASSISPCGIGTHTNNYNNCADTVFMYPSSPTMVDYEEVRFRGVVCVL